MLRILPVLIVMLMLSYPAQAKLDKRALASLASLDEKTKLEQVCGSEAMDRIGADKSDNHEPDRAVADATAASVMKGDTLVVRGGAIRSHHHWYHLAYTCTGSKNHLSVIKMDYTIGGRIPAKEWDADNLWD